MEQSNSEKFSVLKSYALPIGQYAITGSGPLGARNLRVIGDIDIIVSLKLWDQLADQYGVVDSGGVKKIVFPNEAIEAFQEDSFYGFEKDETQPTVSSRIKNAEMIDGLPFEQLDTILFYKRKMNQEKDALDIQLIENWIRENKPTK